MRSHSSASAPATGPRSIRPALLTRVSNRPNRPAACCTAASAWVRSVMSASTASAVPPALPISATRASRRSWRRATSATQAPCSASRRAVAAPMPLLAPVTRAAVPASFDSAGCCPVLWMYGAGQAAGASPQACVLSVPVPVREPVRLMGSGDSGVVVGEVAGQLAVGAGLGQEVPGLVLGNLHGVGAGHEARRRLVLARELDQRA